MNITIAITDSKWQLGLDAENARLKARHDATQATLVITARTAYVPVTLASFAQANLLVKAEMQGRQFEQLVIAQLGNSPEIQSRLAKLLMQPQAIRDQFAAQVDALPLA